MKKNLVLPALIGTGFVFAGCGGGSGGGGTTQTGPTQTAAVGNASISYQGQLRSTVTASTQAITSLGVAGANITGMSYIPNQVLANTSYVFGASYDIFSFNQATNATTNLTHSMGPCEDPSVSANGVVAYLKDLPNGSSYDLWTMKLDGSSQKRLTSGTNFFSASIAPNGATIAAISSTGTLYKISSSGAMSTLLSPSGSLTPEGGAGVSWSPDNTRIAFCNTAGNVYTIPIGGGTPTQISSGTAFEYPSWSPDSSQILVDYSGRIFALSSTGPSTQSPYGIYGTSNLDIYGATFSPDGTKIVFAQGGQSVAHGYGTCDPNGFEVTPVTIAGFTNPSPIVWTPFIGAETLVGSGGVMSPSGASGFVLTNTNKTFGSLLSFSATTASTATISNAASNSPTTGPLEFTCSADSITSVYWLNSYTGSSVVKNLTTTPQLVFGVDSTAGTVSFVAPAATPANKSNAVSRVSTGATTVYTGKFSAVYDGQGNNLAPDGAASITVDANTHRVLTVK